MSSDYKEFYDQPSYRQFRRAYAEEKAPLVIVGGSGLSAPAKLPSWVGLHRKLVADAEDKARNQNSFGDHFNGAVLRAALDTDDLWVSFQLLRKYLTQPVFEKSVEWYLTPDNSAPIPSGYLDLMTLRLKGWVTLNIDKFSAEALAQSRGSGNLAPITSLEIAAKWQQLAASRTFLVYLHGVITDPSTWVFTQDDLTKVLSSPAHRTFLEALFLNNIVLFVGVSADDIALSQRLMDLRASGFRPRNLYWLTNRVDAKTEAWASDAYISLIKYQARTNDDHGRIIRALVDDCSAFVSKDTVESAPLVGLSKQITSIPGNIISDPEELAQQAPEYIRKSVSLLLDQHLTGLSGDELIKEYRKFCDKYDFAIDRAFYRGKASAFSRWFDYQLEGAPIGRGNFGEVYSATDSGGNLVAVKIMHKSIFDNDDMLAGFRRGVRSMNIVTDEAVEGMVPIAASFELPPTIVMPYVQGVSVEDAIRRRKDIPWLTKLEIVVQAAKIVSEGHALPQTVLHRDLKPSNIMISNYEYTGSFDPEVVVLDFDMSWHKGSKEKDVIFESRDDFGYLAPEQTDASSAFAARSTRVDSYGFGMTIFYVFGEESPRPNEGLSDAWMDRATRSTARGYDQDWRSAPARLGRLITRATRIDQSDRIDFASLTHELEFTRTAILNPSELGVPEFWAEEVLARAAGSAPYDWDDATGTGKLLRPSGVEVSVGGNFKRPGVDLTVRYVEGGSSDRSNIGKYLASTLTSLRKGMADAGWSVTESRSGQKELVFTASIGLDQLRGVEREENLSYLPEIIMSFK